MTDSVSTLPPAVIIDIDGTVALHVLPDGTLTRHHHHYRAVGWDLPNQPVIDTVSALHGAGHQIVFCSGRPIIDEHGFNVGEATYHWLRQHVGEWALSSPLFMRAQGDRRPDDLTKAEIYELFIRDHYDVRFALDDRPRVIRMWMSLGIPVFDVAPGSGEF